MENLFNTDFSSIEVCNMVSSDHSLLKAVTNNVAIHGK